jgi:hypothetical protein
VRNAIAHTSGQITCAKHKFEDFEKNWRRTLFSPAGRHREKVTRSPFCIPPVAPNRKNRQKMQAPRAGKMTFFFKNGLFGGEPLGHHLGHPELMNS